MMDYLKELNEQQQEAVLHTEGPLMIVAGAGSGKTKVLTTRIAHLINKGVDSFHILALTFTNKAAAEMKDRIAKMLGNGEAKNLYIGTFHSVFARVLRAEAEKLGYPRDFTIYDTDDAKSVLKELIKQRGLDEKLYKPAYVYNRISSAKNSLIGPLDYKDDREIQQEDARNNRPAIGELYDAYVKQCFKNGAMDFDDILMNMYILLYRFPETLAKYQHKFKYVMIDEYQDTNLAQYHIIKLIAAVNENICVVGDDAQSIYSFRGANLQNIYQFKRDYPDLRTIKLEQNYRSTKNILNAANEVIRNNGNQIEKSLWTDKEGGEKIKVAKLMSDNDEGRYVADTILEQKLRNHYRNSEFAILYRTNAQSRSFEESLRRLNIAYRIYGGVSFYQRKEIKDYIAYLRVLTNPQDEEAIKRIINLPARGIGTTTLQKISLAAQQGGKTFWEMLCQAKDVGISGKSLNAIENFVLLIQANQAMAAQKNAYELAMEIGRQSGLLHEYNADKTIEGLARYENIEELLSSIKEFVETPDADGELANKSLGEYLQNITLLTDADEAADDEDVVKLMTVHAAKGLEFSCVFVVGMEENLFPSAMSMHEREDLEEERRLFYVAITRAKQRLWISHATHRYRFGSLISNNVSRFIDELPKEVLDISVAEQNNNIASTRFNAPGGWGNETNVQTQKKIVGVNAGPVHVPSANFTPSEPASIIKGARVEHQRFGYGFVFDVEGGPNDKKAVIDFEKGVGRKTMMLNFAKLRLC